MTSDPEKRAEINRIADDIVELVERTNGPVLFSDLDDKVPGFHSTEDPAHAYFSGHEELVIWDGMTEAGLEALDKILRERRVAMQMVSLVFPLMLGTRLAESAAPPYVLLPVRAANIETPNGAMRVSPKVRRKMLLEAARTGNQGYRPLKPREVPLTADQFSF
jgi:hypothetical protein